MTGASAPARALLDVLGVDIDPELLELALTHRSYAYEHGVPDNERLEFLGDSVLGRAVTVMLYTRYPGEPEGQLAKRRSALVSTVALARIAGGIGVGPYIRLGRGEVRTGGDTKPSILADTMEALIGAAFLSLGSEAAEAFVLRIVAPLADDPDGFGAVTDPKTALQEIAARRGTGAPVYAVHGGGPEHARIFTATVTIGESAVATGEGSSKKAAETAAAWAAFQQLTKGAAAHRA